MKICWKVSGKENEEKKDLRKREEDLKRKELLEK